MGNCLTSTKVVARTDEEDYEVPPPESIKETRKVVEAAEDADEVLKIKKLMKKKKKKVVRFKLDEELQEGNVESGKLGREAKDGVARIRIVVTQKELKQILSSGIDLKKYSSMEELIKVMKWSGTSVSDDGNLDGANWRPALETIPEEYY